MPILLTYHTPADVNDYVFLKAKLTEGKNSIKTMAQSFGLKIRIRRIVRRAIIVRKRANDQVFLVFLSTCNPFFTTKNRINTPVIKAVLLIILIIFYPLLKIKPGKNN